MTARAQLAPAVKKSAAKTGKSAVKHVVKKATAASKAKPVITGVKKTSPNTLSVRVGAVTVEISRPTGSEIQRNVKTGQSALKRGGAIFAKPGVTLPPRSNAPLYYADPSHPNQIIQEKDGKIASGRFVNGRFVVANTNKVRAG